MSVFGKWVSIRCKKDWPILVATFLLYCGLNHITFRWRLLFLFSWLLVLVVTHEDYANDTELSKEYWDIKRNNFIPKVTRSIVRECPPYSLSKRKCYLCLNEKLEINSYKGNNLLNKRLELINKCRHLNKHTLLRHDTKD